MKLLLNSIHKTYGDDSFKLESVAFDGMLSDMFLL